MLPFEANFFAFSIPATSRELRDNTTNANRMSALEAAGESVGQLFSEYRGGNKQAADQLIALFYPELRRLAAAKMRQERAEHSWQPTLLVNELYVELIKMKALEGGKPADSDKQAFFGLAAFLMKRLLIHHARPLAARAIKVPLDDYRGLDSSRAEDLHAIEDLLAKLGAIDPRLRTVVELKVFEGMSVEEIASQLGCAPRTVARRWQFARQWLQEQLSKG